MRRRRTVTPIVVFTVAVALSGCAAPYLSRIDAAGRDPAMVDADKLACSQEAQARLTWGELAIGVLLGPAGSMAYEARSDAFKARQRRIEEAGEACMLSRGYRLKTGARAGD